MRNLAFIAHDEKKHELLTFIQHHLEIVQKFMLITTGRTGNLLESLNLHVMRMQHGPYGGDAQIAAMLVNGEIEGLFFLRDPLNAHPHDSDITMLLRLADVHNVPTATNLSTAHHLICSLANSKQQLDQQEIRSKISEQVAEEKTKFGHVCYKKVLSGQDHSTFHQRPKGFHK
ncbi:MAG: methylglyoxal synthase [Deltaproteobacteria bacterium]|nr:methylglyoxal synthase [Deltaproteobacteria bacterium]